MTDPYRDDYPHSIEAERMVLGSILYEPDCLDELALTLGAADFYRDSHQRLYEILLERRRAGESCIYPDVHLYLQAKGLEEKVANLDELRGFVDSIPSAYHAAGYAATVLEYSKRRQQIEAAKQFLAKLQDPDQDVDDLAGAHVRRVETIRVEGSKMRAETFGKVARDAIESMRLTASGEFSGLPTPWVELDKMIGGLEPGRLIVLAGRPGSGKSSAALNMVRSVAGAGAGVYVISLEMSNHELGVRQLSSETNIWGSQLLFSPDALLPRQWAQLEAAAAELDKLPVWIDHTGFKTIDEIVDESRAYVKRHGVGMVVVDHIGIIGETKAQKKITRQQFIGEITRSLKMMAKDLRIPVVALSQLNREMEKRNDKRPLLSDLRESGTVEQDADSVLMIYGGKDRPDSNEAELIVRKNRCGPCGTVYLNFDANTTTFRSASA